MLQVVVRLVLPEIFSSVGSLLSTKKSKHEQNFRFLLIPVFFDFSAIFTKFPWIKVILRCESLQKLWSIYKNFWNIINKIDLARFTVFFDQNVGQLHFMRQQAITLIFLLVIEDIKVYYLGYLKAFALRKSQALFAKSWLVSHTHHILNFGDSIMLRDVPRPRPNRNSRSRFRSVSVSFSLGLRPRSRSSRSRLSRLRSRSRSVSASTSIS
jgi:hypothetical protein